MSSPSSSPAPAHKMSASPAPEASIQSTFARFVVAPMNFISFLISLALIDMHHSWRRTHFHSPNHAEPSSSFLGRAYQKLHSWIYRPQPYSYVRNPESKEAGSPGRSAAGEEQWHWNTQQKKMMRMEVGDAYALKKRVLIVLAAAVIGMFGFALWTMKRLLRVFL